MCIFSRPVDAVTATNILVFRRSTGRQITVYSNRVALSRGTPTAMILPVPVRAPVGAGGDVTRSITVFGMPPSCTSFFATLAATFPADRDRLPTFGMDGLGGVSRSAPLPVLRAGAYRYSIVPSPADFTRLASDVFKLDAASDLYSLLATNYGVGHAFLVCIIDASAEFVPIAYEHDMPSASHLFVPTMHYHGPGGHALRVGGARAAASKGAPHADWDHNIYSIGTSAGGDDIGLPSGMSGQVPLAAMLAAKGVIAASLPFPLPEALAPHALHRKVIKGPFPNMDLRFKVTDPSLCTYAATGVARETQPWFICLDCRAAGLFELHEGACVMCNYRCHIARGHTTVPAGVEPFFCDCGAKHGTGMHTCACAAPAIMAPGLAAATAVDALMM